MTLLSLEGRVAMVTGGSGGIGSAVVRRLLEAGADVVSVDLPGSPVVDGAESIDCDLAQQGAVDILFRAYRARFDRLDVLVHCAGITRDAVLWKMTTEDWETVMHVNLGSAFFLLREGAPMMRARGEGAVVLVSSINAERGKFGQSNYTASKAGLIGLARTAARELGGFGIRVNVVSPGLIDTAMTASLPAPLKKKAVEESALGRSGQPDDVARSVLFLVSDMSRHVTGQVLRVDGGQLIA